MKDFPYCDSTCRNDVLVIMERKYSIANFNISAKWSDDEILEKTLKPYEKDFDGDSDIKVSLSYTDLPIVSDGKSYVKLSDNKFYYRTEDGNDNVLYYDIVSGSIISKVSFSPDYSSVKILAYNVKNIYDIGSDYYLLNLFDNMMRYCMQMHSSFVFHSSAIGCSDGGVVFSAVSGTGKSTHTSLWLREFSDAYIVNDDSPIIRLEKSGDVNLCGTPWAGTTGINTNTIIPLKAIVFLERGEKNSIEEIAPIKSVSRFMAGVSPALNAEMLRESFDTLNKILSRVPSYVLRCNMEPKAAHVAREKIFSIQ